MRKWFVYMLLCSDGTFYTGVTVDLEKRIAVHNAGKGAKYTRGRLPVTLVWSEVVGDEGAVKRREYAVKKLSRREKEVLVGGFWVYSFKE